MEHIFVENNLSRFKCPKWPGHLAARRGTSFKKRPNDNAADRDIVKPVPARRENSKLTTAACPTNRLDDAEKSTQWYHKYRQVGRFFAQCQTVCRVGQTEFALGISRDTGGGGARWWCWAGTLYGSSSIGSNHRIGLSHTEKGFFLRVVFHIKCGKLRGKRSSLCGKASSEKPNKTSPPKIRILSGFHLEFYKKSNFWWG